jgi:uncharacterized membrane protein YtjA (UPF0391 family)
MLYYSGILIVIAFISATLGFVFLEGTAAFIMRLCFVGAAVLFVASLARRNRRR